MGVFHRDKRKGNRIILVFCVRLCYNETTINSNLTGTYYEYLREFVDI